MSDPKKHHYVPQFLLKNFSNEQGMLFYITKKSKNQTILSSKPENVFFEKHLYSKPIGQGKKDTSLEKAYSELEFETSRFLSKIISHIRMNKTPEITNDEQSLWAKFFYNQWKRVPDMHEQYFTEDNVLNSLKDTDAARENPDEYKEFEQLINSNSNIKKDVIQTMKVGAIGFSSGRVERHFENFGIGILYIKKENKSFLIGSNSIAHINTSQNFAFDSRLWLPISHDIALCPTRLIHKGCLIKEANSQEVRLINQTIFETSTMSASRSEKLIQSFL